MSFLFVAAEQSKNLHAKRKIVLILIISNNGVSCVGGSIFARSLNVDCFLALGLQYIAGRLLGSTYNDLARVTRTSIKTQTIPSK